MSEIELVPDHIRSMDRHDQPPALNPNPPFPIPQPQASTFNDNSNIHYTLHQRRDEDFPFQNQFGTLCKYVGRVVIIGIHVLLGLALYLYLHYKPQPPRMYLSSVSLHEANLDATSNPFSYNITLNLNISNPNPRVHLHLHRIVTKLVVAQTIVGTTNLPSLEMKVHDSQLFSINMFGRHFGFKQNQDKLLREAMENGYNAYSLYIKSRVKSILGTSRISYSYQLLVLCVFITSSPPDGVLLSQHCMNN